MLMKVFIIIFLVGGVFSQWTAANIDVRLVGNRTHFPYGRVQVLHNGTWGTMCNRQWNLNDGHVVCRQLGFDGAVSAFSESRHEPGTKWMNNLQCRGNESSISGCIHGSWIPVTYCLYHAVAMCTLQVRLTERSSEKEGLVQLYINNTWGRVCGEHWDKQDADVVCRWLGYHASSEAYTTYLQISADIWINNVQCTGNEDTVFTCTYDGWTNSSCMSNRMAGVRCNGSEVMLVSRGSFMDVLVGGFRGPVCSSFQWQLQNANVFCRQLGYHGALAVSRVYHERSVEVCLQNMRCVGNESSILRCKHDGWTSGNFVISVVCSPTAARLVEGPSVRQGLVQMYYNRTWGWACAEQWDKRHADVVCRELGFTGSSAIYNGSTGVSGNDTLFINNIHCTGDESLLVSCAHGGWTHLGCRVGQIAGVVCTGREVRLVSRGSSLPARMEVLSGGFWGPVCSFFGDTENGNVFCRQLGYDGALAVSSYEEQHWEICLKVQCIGKESSILGCRNSGWTSDYFLTSVLCSPAVRLVEGPSAREGLVQAYYNRTWGWVCAEQWDKRHADVVCKELGYTGSSTIYNKSPNVRGNVTLWMSDIRCTGNESRLVSCTHGGWKFLGCGSVGQTAGVACAGHEVRLASNDSPLRRVEVLFDGFWGPVCSYQWDIKDANVVCRQLGHGDALAMPVFLMRIFMRNTDLCLGQLECSGNESSVLQCRHGGWSIGGYGEEEQSGILVARALCSPTGRPEYVSSDLDSVYMTWISSQSLNYTVQMWNNNTRSWETARCYHESKVVGACVVNAPRATVVGLTSSSTYFFRIIVDNMTISATSKPMKTKQLGTPGKPLLVSKTFITITIKWNSPNSLYNITYAVQMQPDTDFPWMDAKCKDQSILPNRCIVKGSVAMVTGLKRNTVYRFRVYAVFKGVRSDFSLPSDSIRTAVSLEEDKKNRAKCLTQSIKQRRKN